MLSLDHGTLWRSVAVILKARHLHSLLFNRLWLECRARQNKSLVLGTRSHCGMKVRMLQEQNCTLFRLDGHSKKRELMRYGKPTLETSWEDTEISKELISLKGHIDLQRCAYHAPSCSRLARIDKHWKKRELKNAKEIEGIVVTGYACLFAMSSPTLNCNQRSNQKRQLAMQWKKRPQIELSQCVFQQHTHAAKHALPKLSSWCHLSKSKKVYLNHCVLISKLSLQQWYCNKRTSNQAPFQGGSGESTKEK